MCFFWLAMLLAITPLHAQKNKPSANIEQLRNGSLNTPIDPGIWVGGNLGSSNSHYAEALSAPYRVVMTKIAPSTTVTIMVEYDVQHSGKLALDYLTSYDRLEPHSLNFGHNQEEVNPTIGTALFQSPPETPTDIFQIPAPSVLNSPVADQPVNSYNNVAGDGQAEMAIWNGDITNVAYVGNTPDLSSGSNQSQLVEVTFIAGNDPSETVILAFGGHLASRNDWGFDTDGSPRSAGGISGSPYHMRLDSWNLGNLGNQDLSLSVDAILVPDPPVAPSNFTATAIGISEIVLEWEEVSASNATYTIERSLTGTDSWEVIASDLPKTTTSYSDAGLSEFTTYFYRISASNPDGTSDFSTAEVSTFSVISTVFNRNGKSREIIGLDLEALNEGEAGEDPSELNYQFDAKGDVLVEVVAFLNPNTIGSVVTLLQQQYGRVLTDFILDPQFYAANNRNIIDVYFPIDQLDELNLELDVNFVRPAYLPFVGNHELGETGVLSQGDSSQTSRDARASFKVTRLNESGVLEALPVDGSGIKIGVLSNSFNTQPFSGADSRYVTDQKNFDLPGPFNSNRSTPVEVLEEAPFSDTDEGRAMLQIVHDVAPGAELGFHHGTTTLNKFVEGINALSAAGYQVITDDITFLPELFFKQSGPAFDAINNHTSTPGNMYFTSSGNFADQAEQGIFNGIALPGTAEIYPSGITGFINDFGGGSSMKPIFVNPGEYVLVLQWDENAISQGDLVGAVSDLDVFITDDNLRVMAGNNRINIEGDPTEILIIRSTAPRAANLVVTCECETPPSNLGFRIIAFKVDGEGDGLVFTEPWSGPTVSGHAMSENAVTVGASFYGYYGTPAGPDLEPFSSLAGTLPNGQNISVDLTGPDGGNTNVLSIGSDINFDHDTVFPNFFGTSAAAPHVAAGLSLMLSALPTWYPAGVPAEKFTEPPTSNNPADQALALFLQTASSVSDPAKGGAGLVQTEAAFQAIASQTPFLSGEFISEEGKIISAEDVIVTLIGDYFSPDSKVFFDGEEIPTTFISETEIQAVIPPFSGAGQLVVTSTPSSTPGGGDGGDSNGIDLLDGRRALAITADDLVLEFGQDFDDLTFTASGLEEGETYESLGLPDIVLTSTATGPFPDVNNYTVFPEFAEPLSPEQEDLFIVTFFPGTVSFTKKALTIQASDTMTIYGDEPGIELNYLYDPTGITDNALFLNTIQSEHEATYYQDASGVGLVNRFTAVVNDNPDRAEELITLIQNSNWMATETSISNRFTAVVNDFNVLKFEADQLLDYLNTPLVGNSTALENRFTAVVNGGDLVTGLTSVYNPIENRFTAVVNDFSALVNRFTAVVNVPLGDENDNNDYSTSLAIIDVDDGAPEGSDPNSLPPVNVYSINLITGLEVTPAPTPTNDQRHWIVPGAYLSPFGVNFDIGFQAGRLNIDPKPIVIDLEDGEELPIEIDYGDPIPTFTSTIGATAFDEEITVNYNLNPAPTDPVGAGTYNVVQNVLVEDAEGMETTSNYSVTTVDGSLLVHPGTLTVSTEDALVAEGDDLSGVAFTSTITGFIPGETEIDVFPPDGPVFDHSSPEYESAGRVAGTYVLLTTVTPNPLNYNVVDNTAQVIVNLADGQKIRIFLDCVAQNNGNNAEWPFTAYFRYENDNAVSIFIEPGTPDNEIIGTSYDGSSIPFEFLPGSHQVPIPFDGENLRWKVSTFGSTNPSSQEVSSNDINGNRCKAKDIETNARTAGTDNAEEDLLPGNADDIQFYPNPVTDKLVVQFKQGFNRNDIALYDSQGLRRDVNVSFDEARSTAEFDFSNTKSGLYLLKFKIEGTTTLIRILRQ